MSDKNSKFSSSNGVLYNKNKIKLIQYPVGKTDASFAIPKTVTAKGNGNYKYKKIVKTIKIKIK